MESHCQQAAFFVAATALSQTVVTPVFVHKDGCANLTAYRGSEKTIMVDGGANQTVGWITFQAEGIDLSRIASGVLALYVKNLASSGTLKAYGLTSAKTQPENSVPPGNSAFNASGGSTRTENRCTQWTGADLRSN